MIKASLIDVATLQTALDDRDLLVFDCRFNLVQPHWGRQEWLAGHVPGARYAHLDDDLAGPVTETAGRHPLPSSERFAQFLGRSGYRPGMRVVAYDQGPAFLAVRLWWLMHYFGLEECEILDGGFAAWRAAGLPLETGSVEGQAGNAPALHARRDTVLSTPELERALATEDIALLDARSAERFRGEAEPIDPVAGHVPGALSHPCEKNVDADGYFLAPESLREALTASLGGDIGSRVVHMCGSGVTGCHNLFAMSLCGLDAGRLYAGSWSEWIRDSARPVAHG